LGIPEARTNTDEHGQNDETLTPVRVCPRSSALTPGWAELEKQLNGASALDGN